MKKAKIMLTVMAVVGIVGAGLAFKAHKTPTNYTGCDGAHCLQIKNNNLPWTTVDQGLGSFAGTDVASTKTCTIDSECGTLFVAAE